MYVTQKTEKEKKGLEWWFVLEYVLLLYNEVNYIIIHWYPDTSDN